MSKRKIVHKQDPNALYWDWQAKCGAITQGSLNTTKKWPLVTCKHCLRKRPKPKK